MTEGMRGMGRSLAKTFFYGGARGSPMVKTSMHEGGLLFECANESDEEARALSSAIGFLPYSHSLNISFSNLLMEHLFYCPYLPSFSLPFSNSHK